MSLFCMRNPVSRIISAFNK
ncbi:hypothetical protein J4218_04035 [Candidatus Pacearchaeota archaeon]|nr:hypothetical protein [Candidatus Pacearchaeota archaeon]